MTLMIKPASSLCNLRCRYCFYSDVSGKRNVADHGIMSEETADILVQRIFEAADENAVISISFQGGEPSVAGLPFFRGFTERFAKRPDIHISWSLQTNGTLLDEEFVRFLKEKDFLVGISLDGYQSNHDRYRLDSSEKGVFYKVLQGLDLLKKYDVRFNVLTVVTRELAAHPKALFQFFKTHHLEYIQLIPCLPDLNRVDNEMSLTPEAYDRFFNAFFDLWVSDLKKGGTMSVSQFENIACLIQGLPPYQCGYNGSCRSGLIIESNGDAYPCDFYCLDEYRLGSLKESSFEQLLHSEKAASFLAESECRKEPCHSCPYEEMCHGGCRRQNVCWLKDDDCAYQRVLDHIVPSIRTMLARRPVK